MPGVLPPRVRRLPGEMGRTTTPSARPPKIDGLESAPTEETDTRDREEMKVAAPAGKADAVRPRSRSRSEAPPRRAPDENEAPTRRNTELPPPRRAEAVRPEPLPRY